MSTSLTTGKRSSGAQAQKKCESTFVNKAEGCFCSSQAIIRRVPNSSAPRGAEAEQPRLHQPKPLQAEPHTCKPPKTSASLPGSSPQFPQAHPHRVQNLKISHFALSLQLLFPAPASSELGLPHLTLTQNLSPVLLKPTAQRRRTHTKSGNLLSGHHDSSARVCLAIAIGQEKLQKSPGASASLPSQADTCAAPPRPSSFLTTVHVICGTETG